MCISDYKSLLRVVVVLPLIPSSILDAVTIGACLDEVPFGVIVG